MEKKYWLSISAVLAILLLAGLVSVFQPYQMRGSLIEPAAPAPPIQLPATDGTLWELSDQNGKLVVIFFGYTHCPDVCPATLGEMKSVKERLGSQAGDIQFVLITVDPQRDSLEEMNTYLERFDPEFIGLGGTPEQLDPVYQAYGVFIARQEKGSAAGYLVDHSARTYLIDRHNNLRVTYTFGTPIDDLVSDVRFLLREK